MTKRLAYQLLGFCFVLLATLGVILPLLPTTPFLLLAAACFARSSEKWHQWLLRNRIFGPILKDWEQSHKISLKVKIVAVSSIVLVGGYSIAFAIQNPWIQAFGGLMLLIGLIVVLRIPHFSR